MKFLVVLALCAAVASANLIGPISSADMESEIKEIIAAINSPSTDPATAAALQQMLHDLLGMGSIVAGPAIVEGDNTYEPISVGPAIVDGIYEPISVGPAIVDGIYEPISVGPAIVDEQVAAPASSPLVQIIVNVNANSGVAGSPVAIEGMPAPAPAVVDEIIPTPVIVVDQAEPAPEPVIVVDEAQPAPEPVIVVDTPQVPVEPVVVAPIVAPPVVALPGILN